MNVFDWNEIDRKACTAGATFLDETLRDGLQNPSIVHPGIEQKIELLHRMNTLGIADANIGIPGSSPRAFDDCLHLCKEIETSKLAIRAVCAGRTKPHDVRAILELSQRAGIPIEGYLFVGSSPIRQYVEEWDMARIIQLSTDAIDVAVKEGLAIAYVTEDTTRSRPDALTTLFRAAIEHGASRLCLCDTVGHATRDGVRNLVHFTRGVLAEIGAGDVGIDWHGHNDRGLALDNAIAAIECGVGRVHATALGIGERAGNVPMELLLTNMKLFGYPSAQELTGLPAYVETAAKALDWPTRRC